MNTVCAISTSIGRAGLGIVRMTGDESFEILKKVFSNSENIKNRKLTYGHIIENDTTIDEVLVAYMKAPHTYTREDVVEIYCHGGVVAVRAVLQALLNNGADIAEPGEFTKRAFLNGRLDLSEAEAVLDLIDSNTSLSYETSLKELSGSVSEKINHIKSELMAVMASTITEIDFPEDENDTLSDMEKVDKLSPILSEIDTLLINAKRGKVIRDGIKTLIIGRPNVGKSSLLNALLRENRAIVTDIPGTTRDTIEEIMDLDGIPLRLIDTAGIRDTEDEVERIGVTKARDSIESADLVLVVLDASSELSDGDLEILDATKNKERIVILNKTDLDIKLDKDKLNDVEYIETSFMNEVGLEVLLEKIKDLFFSDKIKADEEVLVSNMRHIEHLRKAKKSLESAILDLNNGVFLDLVEVDLNDALEELGKITGETATEDILDQIFSQFCIGK